MTVNREWHEQHSMPKFAGRQERAAWHAAHQAACTCRVPNAREQQLIDEHHDSVTDSQLASKRPSRSQS
jgi:hypothetical protein